MFRNAVSGMVLLSGLVLSTASVGEDALYSLIDHHGDDVTQASYPGRVQLLFFGFTHCPDVCPMSLSKIKVAYASLDKETRPDFQPIFVSVDPDRDSVPMVADYVAELPGFVGLTGSQADVDATLRAFRVFAMKDIGREQGQYDMTHTSLIYVVDKDGEACDSFSSTIPLAELRTKLHDISTARYDCKGFV